MGREASSLYRAGGQASLHCAVGNVEEQQGAGNVLCSWGCVSSLLPVAGCRAPGSQVLLCFHRVSQQRYRWGTSTISLTNSRSVRSPLAGGELCCLLAATDTPCWGLLRTGAGAPSALRRGVPAGQPRVSWCQPSSPVPLKVGGLRGSPAALQARSAEDGAGEPFASSTAAGAAGRGTD